MARKVTTAPLTHENELYGRGYEYIAGIDEAVAWCTAHGIPLYAVNENPENTYPEQYGVCTTGRKVYADLYVDDKALNAADIERAEDLREAEAGAGQYADNPTVKQTFEYGA